MKRHHIALIMWLGLSLVFVTYVRMSSSAMPEQVATHFDGAGNPNGWTTRSASMGFMTWTGLGLAALFAGMGYVGRFIPPRYFNIPNAEHWLAPEHRQEVDEYLLRHFLWMACIVELFFIGLQATIVEANRHSPPVLSGPPFLLALVAFTAAVLIWSVMLAQHFRKKSDPTLSIVATSRQ
jgi:uncharacterized membrane protein